MLPIAVTFAFIIWEILVSFGYYKNSILSDDNSLIGKVKYFGQEHCKVAECTVYI